MSKQGVINQIKSGQGFTPSKSDDRQPQSEGKPPALPNHNQVLLHHAIGQTQARIAEVDRIWEAAEETVLRHFDQRGEEAKANVAAKILGRMGIKLESPDAQAFFDPTPIDIQGAFDKLLKSATPALPQGEVD